jgi:hypothetical protein
MKLVSPTMAMVDVYIHLAQIFFYDPIVMARRTGKRKRVYQQPLVRINTGDPTLMHLFTVNLME